MELIQEHNNDISTTQYCSVRLKHIYMTVKYNRSNIIWKRFECGLLFLFSSNKLSHVHMVVLIVFIQCYMMKNESQTPLIVIMLNG